MTQVQTRSTTTPTPTTGAPSRMNRMAVWALVLAILTLGGVGSVLGIVLGAKARGTIDRSGERGRGVATAAIVVGVLTTLVAIGYWILIARHFGGSGAGGGGGGTGGTGGGGSGGGY